MVEGTNAEAAAPPPCASCCHLKRSQISCRETCGVMLQCLLQGEGLLYFTVLLKGRAAKSLLPLLTQYPHFLQSSANSAVMLKGF